MSIYGIRDALLEAKQGFAFTGAGISVPSGIPDFRSSEGIWARYPPEEYGTIQAFLRDPEEWWEFYRALAASFAEVEPNPAHRALAELEQLTSLAAVVTQNVDQLHQRAGSGHVIELHGTSERLTCLTCQRTEARPAPVSGPAPRCETCARVLKPDVVLFGEELPLSELDAARELAQQSEVCLVVGTSAVVYPAAAIPEVVARGGGTVCQINAEPTDLTHLGFVRWFVEGKAEELLPRLVDLVRAELGQGARG